MKNIFLSLMLLFLAIPQIQAEEKEYIILGCREAGMFSIWFDVLSLVHGYEQGLYQGIEVDFAEKGFYYEPSRGKNWWNYYCEPIVLGNKSNVLYSIGDPPGVPGPIEKKLNRSIANHYIDSYMHLKPEIAKEIDQYEIDNFLNNYIISIHYRGTDKLEHEAKEVPYYKVITQIDRVVREYAHKPWKIFVATDEQKFLDFLIYRYGDKVLYYDCERSSNGQPLHLNSKNPYQQGKEALIDCVLLSRGNYLIRTASNLSTWSTYFNSSIPVYELSQLELH